MDQGETKAAPRAWNDPAFASTPPSSSFLTHPFPLTPSLSTQIGDRRIRELSKELAIGCDEHNCLLPISYLDLSRTNMGDRGLRAVGDLMRRNPPIEELRLDSNFISNEVCWIRCRGRCVQPGHQGAATLSTAPASNMSPQQAHHTTPHPVTTTPTSTTTTTAAATSHKGHSYFFF